MKPATTVSLIVELLVQDPGMLAITECVARKERHVFKSANWLLEQARLEEMTKASFQTRWEKLLKMGILQPSEQGYNLSSQGAAAREIAVHGIKTTVYL